MSREIKSFWEIISIADQERKENWKVKKAFQNNQTAEPLQITKLTYMQC